MESIPQQERLNHSELKLVIKIRSYWSLPDGGPKTYIRRESLTTIVDSHSYGLLQLVNYIGERFVWGSKQHISLWRSLEDASIEIRSDEQLLEWFELNRESRVVHIDAQINDFEGPLQFSPTKRRCHPTLRNKVDQNSSTQPIFFDLPVDPTQPTEDVRELINERATHMNERDTNEKSTKKGEKSKRRGVHDEEEPVGVDEEGNYSETESLVALSDSSYDTDLAASSDSDCSEYEPEDEIVDEDDEDDFSIFSYDVDDPCVDIGVVFPDVKQCKSALTQHAILHDYAFRTVKKDKKRFRAKCLRADKGCKWTFFASTSSKKYIGCKVKKNGPTHKCSSVNNCGDTMATSNWVAERVVDWLKDDSRKGPKELLAELKKRYSIEIPYTKVFRGKEKAIDMIYGKWDDSYDLLPTYRADRIFDLFYDLNIMLECDQNI